MPNPIIDKAEVSIDFPHKFYHGSFGRSSQYDVKVDENGVHIALDRTTGEKRHVSFHLHHYLFGDILNAVADEIAEGSELTGQHRERLREAATKLAQCLVD